ncbi:MAG: thrombospondin type 3 repeat-containing protein [Verrucomicrobia bacterium]|nr:thrombospondin type 3 repeat-containing protein [Verrucomicrobiota bacterium]
MKDTDIRKGKEVEQDKDVALNRYLVRKNIHWINRAWYQEGKTCQPAQSEAELVDTDGDGWDDYTEFIYHTDPEDPRSTPAAYFGIKKKTTVVFFSTNPTAHRK